MLVIRFQRTGRENLPSYRLVVAEKSAPVKGRVLEVIGHYLPARKQPVFEFKQERITHWVKQGAIPSDTVARLLKHAGVPAMESYIRRYAKRKPKGAEEVQAAAAPAPAAAEAAPPVEKAEEK
ncbi:MAG: 30S ribosomal protein S16 [Candidatus Peribacteraceae bacterium]|nr:30S ribosomal protein S16 [Candidatus Peribacteraceae bacterium]